MKKLLKLLIVIFLLGGLAYAFGPAYLYLSRWINTSFCEHPVTFTVNKIDPKFQISRDEIINETKEAANMWNDLLGHQLFVYDPKSRLDINLVYDERQKLASEVNQNKKIVDQQNEILTDNIEEFDQRKAAVVKDPSDLNDEIQYWNERGGAPRDKYEELVKRQKELQNKVAVINETAKKLNTTSEDLNQKAETLKQSVQKFNALRDYKPEEGVYLVGPNRIDIYIYQNKDEFMHTVAHELGHALGLEHTNQPGTIMYPTSMSKFSPTEIDKEQIQQFCAGKNRFDLIKNDLRNLTFILYDEISRFLNKNLDQKQI